VIDPGRLKLTAPKISGGTMRNPTSVVRKTTVLLTASIRREGQARRPRPRNSAYIVQPAIHHLWKSCCLSRVWSDTSSATRKMATTI
jgi:hypothetical protein